MTSALPLLGAALDTPSLEKHRDWLVEEQRDLELQHFFTADILAGDWRPLAARTKAALRGWSGRLGLHGPFIGFALDTGDIEIRDVVRRRMDQALDVAADVEATQIVVHSPFRTWDSYNLDAIDGARTALAERVHATMGAAVRRAETLGITFVLENIEDKDPMARVELARSFGSRSVGVSLDTGHAYYAHRATGAPPVDFHVRAAGDLLAHVHIQDTDGYADRHWPPGEGSILWPGLFDALARLSSQPRLILELKERDRVPSAAAWLAGQQLAR